MAQIRSNRRTTLKNAIAVGLAVVLVFGYARVLWPAVAPQQPSIEQLQKEIERLKIIIEVKQQRIEMLERELERLRAPLKLERDRRLVREIQHDVERIRGLRAKHDVEMEPLTSETLSRLLDQAITDRYTEEQFHGWEETLKYLGLIPPKMDMREFLKSLYAEQIAGVYDDEEKKLYVSARFDLGKMFTKVILAHEICHALQDQYFNLTSSPIHLKTDDDRAIAALSVIEGDATLLMSEYASQNLNWRLLAELPGLLTIDQQQLNTAPQFITQSLLFPYLQGMAFVMEGAPDWAMGGPRVTRERNRLLAEFPRSSEQILHPRKYFRRPTDEPTAIDLGKLVKSGLVPRKGGFFDNVVGEFGVKVMLMERLTATEATDAAAGWDGDRLVFGADADGNCALAWLSVWDTATDAAEFAGALKRYFEAQRPDLKGNDTGNETKVWLADEKGSVAIIRERKAVICVHAHRRDRAEKIVKVLAGIAAETRVVP